MIKQKVAKRLTDKELEAHASKVGEDCKERYDNYRIQLLAILDQATEAGNVNLAGFMFAFSAVSNEIARRNGIK